MSKIYYKQIRKMKRTLRNLAVLAHVITYTLVVSCACFIVAVLIREFLK